MSVNRSEIQHLPVLRDETVEFVRLSDLEVVVDATLGFGGHSLAILETSENTRVIAFDQDETAIALAGERLAEYGNRLTLIHSNFSDVKRSLRNAGIENVSAVIADLGISSMQIDSESRGFSFRFDSPLDMRMDQTADIETAAEILADRSEIDIANLIYQLGEERFSRRIARKIVAEREAGNPIETTKQLADLVSRCIPRNKKDTIHPATKTFQALRIAVNGELDILDGFITDAIDVLKTDGVLAIITFHSLEDRIVKFAFQKLAGKCFCPPKIPQCVCGAVKRVEILTKKPIVPGRDELDANPRSRSAKLRAVKKVEA
jgi:16S rRNA (cytosine1402-N4)-methyltransferase